MRLSVSDWLLNRTEEGRFLSQTSEPTVTTVKRTKYYRFALVRLSLIYVAADFLRIEIDVAPTVLL